MEGEDGCHGCNEMTTGPIWVSLRKQPKH